MCELTGTGVIGESQGCELMTLGTGTCRTLVVDQRLGGHTSQPALGLGLGLHQRGVSDGPQGAYGLRSYSGPIPRHTPKLPGSFRILLGLGKQACEQACGTGRVMGQAACSKAEEATAILRGGNIHSCVHPSFFGSISSLTFTHIACPPNTH